MSKDTSFKTAMFWSTTAALLCSVTLMALGLPTMPTASAEPSESKSTNLIVNVAPVLSLAVQNCPSAPDLDETSLTLSLIPSPSGTFKSDCQIVSVDTSGPGYALLARANSTDSTNNLLYQNPTTLTPKPFIQPTTGTVSSPAPIATNSWGFGVEGNNVSLTSQPTAPFIPSAPYVVNDASDTYAKLPTTDTPIYLTEEFPGQIDKFNFYYGVKLNSSQPAGTYQTTVTYTAVGEIPVLPLGINSISPTVGFPGDIITLFGTGFIDVEDVLVDEISANFNVISPTKLEFILPPEIEGVKDIEVVTLAETATLFGVFMQEPGVDSWKQISAGDGSSTCGIANNDQVYCWGAGRTHYGSDLLPVPIRMPFESENAPISQISVGYMHNCAIRGDNGQAYCWGSNNSGQLGDGKASGNTSLIPVKVLGDLDGVAVSKISAGRSSTCAIRDTDGQAYCWGSNWQGVLGNGDVTETNQFLPVKVEGDLNGVAVSGIDTGEFSSCAIRSSDGQAYCWGNNGNGTLGNGDTTGVKQYLPVKVMGDLNGAAASKIVVSNMWHVCAIRSSDGQAYCWGGNWDGPLGNNTNVDESYIPLKVLGDFNGVAVSQIAADYITTCGIRQSDSQAYCWGGGFEGQFGNGTSAVNSFFPVKVGGALNGVAVKQISVGYEHVCAIRNSDSQAYCWGYNRYGQVGNGNSGVGNNELYPALVNISGL